MTDRSLLAHRPMSGSVAAELAMEFPARGLVVFLTVVSPPRTMMACSRSVAAFKASSNLKET
jgi:hypothetical protein